MYLGENRGTQFTISREIPGILHVVTLQQGRFYVAENALGMNTSLQQEADTYIMQSSLKDLNNCMLKHCKRC